MLKTSPHRQTPLAHSRDDTGGIARFSERHRPASPNQTRADLRGGISSKLSIVEAFDATGTRLYTLQAFGGGGGIPGGSAFTLARCSSDDSACSVEDGTSACPLLPNGSTQICLPVPGVDPSPGNYGPRGADGPVSCFTLELTPPTPPEEGLICQ